MPVISCHAMLRSKLFHPAPLRGITCFLASGTAMATNQSKKRKFVADGVFYAELNEVYTHGAWLLGRPWNMSMLY